MIKMVRWTDAEREAEARLGVNEVRDRMAKLSWSDRHEVLVAFRQPQSMTPEQAKLWAQFAASLSFTGATHEGERILVDGCRIVRQRSQDELAKLVCTIEVAAQTGQHNHGEDEPEISGPLHPNWKAHDGLPVHKHGVTTGHATWAPEGPLHGREGAEIFLAEHAAAGDTAAAESEGEVQS
jgi:hypothetical protein